MGNIASMTVDYQKCFGDKKVNELYVQGWESIVDIVNGTMKEVKDKGGINIASKDWHKQWNISFASNFIWKKPITEVWPNDPRAFITYDEVKDWTQENNWLGANAWFTLEQIKRKLFNAKDKVQVMWPDHWVAKTAWAEFITWFDDSLVDNIIYKWDADLEHPYSAFTWVEFSTKRSLEQILDNDKVEIIKVTWLATDYCVCDTAIDLANTNKYVVQLILNAMKPVDINTEKEALERMIAAGVNIIK